MFHKIRLVILPLADVGQKVPGMRSLGTMGRAVFFVAWLLVWGANPVAAQNSSSTNLEETALWFGVYAKVRLSDKLGYYAEHHYRTRDEGSSVGDFGLRADRLYNRLGLSIRFNKHFRSIIGSVTNPHFAPDFDDERFKNVTWEYRIWHQWLFIMPPMHRFHVFHRLRFEHRWKRKKLKGSTHQYSTRYRYKLFANIPLGEKNTFEEGTFYGSLSAELFMQSGKGIGANPMEDLRVYNGVGYVYSPNITFFVGHLWFLGQKETGFQYKQGHIFRFNIMMGFDARKAEQRLPPINMGY